MNTPNKIQLPEGYIEVVSSMTSKTCVLSEVYHAYCGHNPFTNHYLGVFTTRREASNAIDDFIYKVCLRNR